MNVKRCLLFLWLLISMHAASAQTDTAARKKDTAQKQKTDTARKKISPRLPKKQDSTNRKRDSARTVVKPAIKPVIKIPPKPIADSLKHDSIAAVIDSVKKDSVAIVVKPPPVYKDTATYYFYFNHPYLGFNKTPVYMVMKEREPQSKDTIFYLLTGLLFFVACTKLLFPKYFQNTFRLFFQTSFRQKQTRDQLLQQGLGSLLLNLLFFFSGAIYIALLVQYYKLTIFHFWELLLYACISLLILYIGKFLFLTFAGWIFNVKEGAQTYIFIVFLINKIIGVMLIPFVLVIAFSDASIANAAVVASLILIALLFFYRYFVSLKSFRRDLHINPFHFFLYLCGVEIVPLLVIGKAIFNYIDGRF